MMSPKNTSEHEGGGFAGDSLETGVVITKNYKRLWFSLRVAVFITLKRSSPSDAPPLQTPTSQRLSRSSSRAEHKIDVPFDCEEEEEEVDRNGDNAINEQQLLLNTVDEAYTSQGRLSGSFSQAEVETSIDLSSDAEDGTAGPTSPPPKDEKVNCNGDDAVNQQQNLRNSVDQIVKEKNWTALKDFGGTEEVISIFSSHLETGLAQDASSDPKTWSTTNPVQAKDLFHFFLKECYSCTNFLLTVSAGLSLATEILQEGPKYGWQDGAIILMAVFLLVTFPSVGKFIRARKLEKQMRKNKLRVEVIRNGESRIVPISNIVQGDIVCLKEGDRVPGDGLYVDGDGLEVDEVLDSSIDRHHNPFLLYGSKVIKGNGRMIVTSDGTNSSIGKLMSMVNDVPNHKPNLLQTRIEQPNEYADKIALCMSILITVVMFLRFRNHHDNKELPELKGKVRVKEVMVIFERALLKPRGLVCILTTYLTAMVLGFQHGVSFIINFSLSHWNEKVESDNAKPRNLSACGTMGFITVICINVSSGLTCGQMEVGKFLIGNEETNNNHGEDCETSQIVREALQRGIGISDLLHENLRSPTDDLLNSWVQSKWGQSMDFSAEKFAIVGPIKWSFNKKGSGVLIRENGDEDVETIIHLHWKGSAKTILRMCSQYYDSEGNIHALEDQKSKFEQEIRDMEDDDLRPIAFAYKRMEVQEISEDGLILLALVGFKYKIGEDDISAVTALRNAGVSIKLVSQDEQQKAIEIAFELGICSRGSNDVVALEGKEFRNLNTNARMEKIDQTTVMGRFLPEDELLMVQLLKQKGHAVTFYGGSTTADTLAIREADVGIVEETLSTEMAREGSDIIVSPGRGLRPFTPLLRHGRCAYHNIQRFIQLQLTACISGLLITVVVTICSGESPITAIQLLWVNYIICILGGRMMVMEPAAQGLMAHQPQAKRTKSLMTNFMWRTIVTQVFYQASVLLIIQFMGQAVHAMKQEEWNSMIFNTFTLCQVFNLFNAMELEKKEVFVVVIRDYWFLMALVVVMGMHVVSIELATTLVVGYDRLSCILWAFCFLFAVLSWVFDRFLTFILDSLSTCSIGSISSSVGISARIPLPYVIHNYMAFIFCAFLIFSLSYY